jgi:hypothetical protein
VSQQEASVVAEEATFSRDAQVVRSCDGQQGLLMELCDCQHQLVDWPPPSVIFSNIALAKPWIGRPVGVKTMAFVNIRCTTCQNCSSVVMRPALMSRAIVARSVGSVTVSR